MPLCGRKEVNVMQVIIIPDCTVKEIAAFVLAVQERQKEERCIKNSTDESTTRESMIKTLEDRLFRLKNNYPII